MTNIDILEVAEETTKHIWPITVTTDRYGGGYSKGKYLAFNLLPWQLPEEIDGDDITCIDFWAGEGCKAYTIGKGSTATEAIEDLESQIEKKV